MRLFENIPYCAAAHPLQQLDLYLPECDSFPVFVYFHGGGLESGDKRCHDAFCRHLAENGIAAVNANYRLYPEAKYPEFLVDAAQAAAWVFRNIGNYGTPKGIYIGGSSAGAYISQMLCFDESWLAAHDLSAMDFAGFIHDAGQPTCHYNVLRERGIDSCRVIVDPSAPLYHVGTSKAYPPMLVIVSDRDMQNRYEQTMLLISTLKHFGFGEKVQLQIESGTHCAYVEAMENSVSVFGKMVCKYILGN